MDELSSKQISIIYLSDLPLLNFPTRRKTTTGRCVPKLSGYIWFCIPRDERPTMLPPLPVGSYPTFSPLPTEAIAKVGIHPTLPKFSRKFFSSLHSIPSRISSFQKYGALCCPDFPPSFTKALAKANLASQANQSDRTVYCHKNYFLKIYYFKPKLRIK
jgi:hypothetical protein